MTITKDTKVIVPITIFENDFGFDAKSTMKFIKFMYELMLHGQFTLSCFTYHELIKSGDFFYKVIMRNNSGIVLFDTSGTRIISNSDFNSFLSLRGSYHFEKVNLITIIKNWYKFMPEMFEIRSVEKDLVDFFMKEEEEFNNLINSIKKD